MTETSTIVCSTSEHDIVNKSSGSVCPATRVKIIDLNGVEVKAYDSPGELWIQTPSAALGYLNNQKATAETFVHDEDGRWVRTGDEAVVTLSPAGNEHVVIVDRIKELIKVKGETAFFPMTWRLGVAAQLTRFSQATKLLLPSSRHTSSHTPPWRTVP